MVVNPIIECFWSNLVPEYYHGLESSAIYIAPPLFVESLQGRSKRNLPCLPLHSHAEEIIPTVLTSNIHIEWCLPKALNLSRLQSYEMFQVLLIVMINKSVGLRGILKFLLAERCVSVPAGEWDSSQGGSSVASTIQCQNSTPSSSHNNSRIADITQSTTQQRSIITPTSTPATTSCKTDAPSGTSQTDSTPCVVSCPTSGISSTPPPLSGLENVHTPILNPEARTIITTPLRMRATEWTQRQRHWQVRTRALSTPWSVVTSSRSIPSFGHYDTTDL